MDINELKETDEAKAQVSRMEKLLETVTKRAGPEGKAPVNLFRLLLHPTSFSQVGHAGLQPPDQQSPGRAATHTRGPYSHTWALLTHVGLTHTRGPYSHVALPCADGRELL